MVHGGHRSTANAQRQRGETRPAPCIHETPRLQCLNGTSRGREACLIHAVVRPSSVVRVGYTIPRLEARTGRSNRRPKVRVWLLVVGTSR